MERRATEAVSGAARLEILVWEKKKYGRKIFYIKM